MKAKHTPGPWSYTQAFMSSWDIRRPDGTQMYFLGASTSIEKGEHEANARLIAASPDLLDLALISYDLASYANESKLTNQPEFLGGLFDRIANFEKAYIAAIAKATGEQP